MAEAMAVPSGAAPAANAGGPGRLGHLDDPTDLIRSLDGLRPFPGRLVLPAGASVPPAQDGAWLYVITRGRLRLGRLSPAGRRVELGVLTGPGCLLGTSLRRGLAEAVEPCELRPLSREQVVGLTGRIPELGGLLLTKLEESLVDRENRIEFLAYHGVHDRLAVALLRTRDASGEVALTHQQLSEVIGSCRETVTKALGQLQDEGLIEAAHRRVRVRDARGLARRLGAI
jgi:CRP/FNR family transcriptional regulator, cyclic AMP receptor protein